MNQTHKTNRGLRHLFLEQYPEEEPDLVISNITRLQILVNINPALIYQPSITGLPHDGGVRVLSNAIPAQRLIWFDFVALLEDEPGVAGRFGTTPMKTWATISPAAFYIVMFPKARDYVAIMPYEAAWRERECMCSSVSVPGPFLPYLLPVHDVPEAFQRISMTAWGVPYANPGTAVVLRNWAPIVEQLVEVAPMYISSEDGPPVPPPSISSGIKRSRDENDHDTVRPAPALRESTSYALPSSGIVGLEFNPLLAEHDLFGLEWQAVQDRHGQESIENIPSGYSTPAVVPGGNAKVTGKNHEQPYIVPGRQGLQPLLEGTIDAVQLTAIPAVGVAVAEEAGWPSLSSTVAPASFEGTQSRTAASPTLGSRPSNANTTLSSSNAESEGEDVAGLPCVIELHPHHAWCNHIYIFPTPENILSSICTPSTPCLPILTCFTRLPDGTPMPLSRLFTTHPCLHVLSQPEFPSTATLLESRIVDGFRYRLASQLNSANTGTSRKSGLRGRNKRRTENPTVIDVISEYGVQRFGEDLLAKKLEEAFRRENKRKEGMGKVLEEVATVCTVGEVLQAQVDGLVV